MSAEYNELRALAIITANPGKASEAKPEWWPTLWHRRVIERIQSQPDADLIDLAEIITPDELAELTDLALEFAYAPDNLDAFLQAMRRKVESKRFSAALDKLRPGKKPARNAHKATKLFERGV
jgi:hypothetical protein